MTEEIDLLFCAATAYPEDDRRIRILFNALAPEKTVRVVKIGASLAGLKVLNAIVCKSAYYEQHRDLESGAIPDGAIYAFTSWMDDLRTKLPADTDPRTAIIRL